MRNKTWRWGVFGLAMLVAAAAQAQTPETKEMDKNLAVMTVAGGCFWCVESDFDKVPGVEKTISGYTGGHLDNPTYQQVSAGGTGHYEAVEIYYDPDQVTYEQLLEAYWHSVDPTDPGGQFCDRGDSYKTAIFVHSPEQRQAAEASKKAIMDSGVPEDPVVTPIIDAGPFYPAEGYHQDYYRKNPIRYQFYRYGCRRDARIHEVWGEQAFKGIPKH